MGTIQAGPFCGADQWSAATRVRDSDITEKLKIRAKTQITTTTSMCWLSDLRTTTTYERSFLPAPMSGLYWKSRPTADRAAVPSGPYVAGLTPLSEPLKIEPNTRQVMERPPRRAAVP